MKHLYILFFILFGSSLFADSRAPTVFREKVENINGYGLIITESGDPIRIWGLIPEPEHLKELLSGKDVICTLGGEVRLHYMQSRVAKCRAQINGKLIDIAEHLILNGKGNELCAESANNYNTCNLE